MQRSPFHAILTVIVWQGDFVYIRGGVLHTRCQLRDELHSLRPYATEPYQTKFAIEELVAAKTK